MTTHHDHHEHHAQGEGRTRAEHVHAAQRPPNEHAHDAATHDKHAGHSVAMFRDKFWVTVFLTLPTLVWGHMAQNLLGYHAPMFTGAR